MSDRLIIGGTDCTEYVRRAVEAAPPLSEASKARLHDLLAPAVAEVAAREARRAH